MTRLNEQAATAAAVAAARASIEIVPVTGADDAHRVSQLLSEIWATSPEQPIVPPEVIRSLVHANGYGAMAASASEIIGAALGFFGRDDGGFYLHSYVAGVKERKRSSSVGFALKLHQRGWALANGLTRVTWTFDPLVRRNAYFNLVKLGATAAGHQRDFYGSMHDRVNAGDLSDRILVDWQLDDPRVVAASEGRPRTVDIAALDAARTSVRVRIGSGGEPESTDERGDIELVQIPDDILAIRAADPGLARRWREAVRDVLSAAFAESARIDGISRDGWYVIRRG